MKLIIAGGRHQHLRQMDYDHLKKLDKVSLIISGGAKGIDSDAKEWAIKQGIPVKTVEAQWQTYGKMAGPLRNKIMAEMADALAIFPGGKGTESMFKEAEKRNLIIFDFRDNAQLYLNFDKDDKA
jgi:predicted Rossmann-fold nucleotide-binding protein